MDYRSHYARGRLWLGLRPWQRHSLVLAVAGFVYVVLGLLYCLAPLPPERANTLQLALRLAPIEAWGVVWVLVGLLALLSTRWPPRSKTWGYGALAWLAALWGSVYALSVVLLDGSHTGITGAIVWFLVAFLWWAISGLTNPDDIPKAG